MIYLDNAATTLRKPPCVIDAVVQAMQTMGNSGRSAHAESLAAARTIFAAREALAALFGCPQPDHVCLTANSTEALNIAISGLLAPGITCCRRIWSTTPSCAPYTGRWSGACRRTSCPPTGRGGSITRTLTACCGQRRRPWCARQART